MDRVIYLLIEERREGWVAKDKTEGLSLKNMISFTFSNQLHTLSSEIARSGNVTIP